MLDLSSLSPSSLLLTLAVPLATAGGLCGCSVGLEFDDCSNDRQCEDGEICNAGSCETQTTTGPVGCAPLDVEACVCTGSSLGTRFCQADGQFGACDCPTGTTSDGPESSDSTTSNATTDISTSTGGGMSSGTSTGDTENGSDSSTGAPRDCPTITPSGIIRDQGSSPDKGNARFYLEIVEPGLGLAVEDEFRIEFWFGAGAGTYDLGTATNTQYATCRHCVRLYEDTGSTSLEHTNFGGRQFLQAEGSMTAADDPQDSTVSVTLTDVRLVETAFDGFNSSPVPDGDCVYVADGTYATPVVPKAWTCDDVAFTDLVCDCGCGAPDGTCDAAGGLGACERCNASGSCDEDGASCPGNIDPDDTTQCVPLVPPAWTCEAPTYADGTCHCGCGAVDVDCPDATSTGCVACNATGSCAEGGADCSTINAAANSECE